MESLSDRIYCWLWSNADEFRFVRADAEDVARSLSIFLPTLRFALDSLEETGKLSFKWQVSIETGGPVARTWLDIHLLGASPKPKIISITEGRIKREKQEQEEEWRRNGCVKDSSGNWIIPDELIWRSLPRGEDR